MYTSSNTYYFFGCTYGAHAEVAPGWTRVRFSNADAFPGPGAPPFPGFGIVQVTGIDIVFDEGTDVGPGFVYLDNINVNGVLIGKPGIAK